MTLALGITLALAVLVGVSLGLLGGGGSILTVPILTYVLGMPPEEAITASLFVVGTTAVVSVIRHARAGRVSWRTGILFGTAGMAGAFAGGLVAGFIPGAILMLLFAGMMVATAVAMIRGRRGGADADGERRHPPIVRILLDGFAVGAVAGLVGAGGGFLIVPALVLLGGLPMGLAVGTSLLVIAMNSFAGLGGHLVSTQVDWPVVLAVTAVAVAGSFVGTLLVGRIPEKALRRGFGWFVLAMGVLVLAQEIPSLVLSLR